MVQRCAMACEGGPRQHLPSAIKQPPPLPPPSPFRRRLPFHQPNTPRHEVQTVDDGLHNEADRGDDPGLRGHKSGPTAAPTGADKSPGSKTTRCRRPPPGVAALRPASAAGVVREHWGVAPSPPSLSPSKAAAYGPAALFLAAITTY